MEILTVGERIMIYRRRAGLSMKDLAGELGVSVATIRKCENSNGEIDPFLLARIATVLNVSTQTLGFGFETPNKSKGQKGLL